MRGAVAGRGGCAGLARSCRGWPSGRLAVPTGWSRRSAARAPAGDRSGRWRRAETKRAVEGLGWTPREAGAAGPGAGPPRRGQLVSSRTRDREVGPASSRTRQSGCSAWAGGAGGGSSCGGRRHPGPGRALRAVSASGPGVSAGPGGGLVDRRGGITASKPARPPAARYHPACVRSRADPALGQQLARSKLVSRRRWRRQHPFSVSYRVLFTYEQRSVKLVHCFFAFSSREKNRHLQV